MAKQEVVSEIKFNVDSATKSVGDLKDELKGLKKELDTVEKGTENYYSVLQKISDTQSEIQDINKDIAALNPEKRFKNMIGTLQGMAASFQALTTASMLFGEEQEEVQQALLKVTEMMALTQSLGMFKYAIGDIKQMYKALITIPKGAKAGEIGLKGMGTALKALGIGLVIAAIAYLIDNLDELKETFSFLIPSGEKTGETFNKMKDIFMGVGKAVIEFLLGPLKTVIALIKDGPKAALEQMKKSYNVVDNFVEGSNKNRLKREEKHLKELLELQIKNDEKALEILKARGADTIKEERRILTEKLKLYKKDSDEYKNIQHQIAIFDAQQLKKKEDDEEKARKKREDDRKKELEEIEKVNIQIVEINNTVNNQLFLLSLDAKERDIELVRQKYVEQIALLNEYGVDTKNITELQNKEIEEVNKRYNDINTEQEKKKLEDKRKLNEQYKKEEFENLEQEFQMLELIALQQREKNILDDEDFARVRLENLEDILIREIELRQKYGDDTTMLEQELVATRIQLSNMEAAAKENNILAIQNALGNLTNAFGRETNAGKAIAVANTLIDTKRSAVAAFSSLAKIPVVGPALGAGAAAAATASGLKAVKDIIKVKVPQGGGGVATPSLGGGFGSVKPPKFDPTLPQQTSTSLSGDDRDLLNRPVKAVVVETDITSTKNRVDSIKNSSEF
jgi:hypothetical protein